jgi:hypothetical protein
MYRGIEFGFERFRHSAICADPKSDSVGQLNFKPAKGKGFAMICQLCSIFSPFAMRTGRPILRAAYRGCPL